LLLLKKFEKPKFVSKELKIDVGGNLGADSSIFCTFSTDLR